MELDALVVHRPDLQCPMEACSHHHHVFRTPATLATHVQVTVKTTLIMVHLLHSLWNISHYLNCCSIIFSFHNHDTNEVTVTSINPCTLT